MSDDDIGRLALRLVAANARLNALALVTAVGLILLGVWMYAGVKESLREIGAAGLQTVLDAEVQALEVRVDDRRAAATHWANEREVRPDVVELLDLSRSRADSRWAGSSLLV